MASIEQIEALFDQKMSIINENIQAVEKKTDSLKQMFEEDRAGRKKTEEIQTNFIKRIENKEKQSNIIIHGINEGNYMNTQRKIMEIMAEMDIKISKYCITNMVKMNKKETDKWNGEGPVKVSLISIFLKQDILRNRYKLKTNGITIKEDLSEETRETRKKLSVFSKKAKDAELKVHMRNDKLVINGKSWTLEQLQNDANETFLDKPKRNRDDDEEGKNAQLTKKPPHINRIRNNSMDNFLKRNSTSD
uniref:Endonuclease-reverse transcriptase n=1 Tax=Cacopsylla melanoneura TaxID=428564 RepID=A0A8D8W272_9HEMI